MRNLTVWLSTAELRGLTFVAVAVTAAGDYHCIGHEVFAEEAQQFIRDRVLFLRGGRLLLWEEWWLLLLPDGIGFPVPYSDREMIKHTYGHTLPCSYLYLAQMTSKTTIYACFRYTVSIYFILNVTEHQQHYKKD